MLAFGFRHEVPPFNELVASFEKWVKSCNDRHLSAAVKDHYRTQIKLESNIGKAGKARIQRHSRAVGQERVREIHLASLIAPEAGAGMQDRLSQGFQLHP